MFQFFPNNTSPQEYFYVVDVLNVDDGFGNPLPKQHDHALVFSAPPERFCLHTVII